MEREFYSIIEDDGRKLLKYWGYTYYRESENIDDEDPDIAESMEFRHCLVPICYLTMASLLGWKPFDVVMDVSEQCNCDFYGFETDEEFRKYVLGYYGNAVFGPGQKVVESGTQLAFEDVTFDTPVGNYWCY